MPISVSLKSQTTEQILKGEKGYIYVNSVYELESGAENREVYKHEL